MAVWVCSKCGMAGARRSEARPSLDDRFAVGYCEKCAPFPLATAEVVRSRRVTRPTVPLVSAEHWDASLPARREAIERARKLLRDFGNADPGTREIRGTARQGGDGVYRYRFLTEKDVEQARDLLAQYERDAAAERKAPAPA